MRRLPFFVVALLFVDFVDEFSSGMPTVGIPGIETDFELSYAGAAFFVFTLPMLVSFLLEPPLFVLADRFPKKYFVVGGLAGMAVCSLVVGLAGGFLFVAGALALLAAASGCGVSLSQATLMDAYPDDRERLMTRWTLMGSLGDLAAPALFWLLAALALGWREAFVATGIFVGGYAIVLLWVDFPAQQMRARGRGAEEAEPSFRQVVAAAFRNRRLLVWLVGVWLCSMLDEVLIAFGALWLREHLGADDATRSVILMSLMLGAIVGLLLLDRLLAQQEPLRLLKVAGIGCFVSYAAWLATDSVAASAACMFAVGLFSSSLYPIAMAQAYHALPGRSGMVNAVGHVFTPLDVLLPLLLGFVADQAGLGWALAILILQPVGLVAIAFSPLALAAEPQTKIG